MEKAYEPKEVETRLYEGWEERGYFHAEPTPGKPKYSITIPPPNVTGSLHMGHALTYTVQDALGRWHKMRGFTTLILPGTDHAGIATQNVVEKQIAKEGLTRFDLGREEFVRRVWIWKEEYGSRIISQLKRLGCAFDWQRERFTIDRGYEGTVVEAFVRFFEKGYIYKGNRMINWCPRCRTVISDIEVEEEDQAGHLWHIRYPYADGSGYVTVATTRPETMLGDTAVAVNPSDTRYEGKIGQMLALPLTDRQIPLIADDYAQAEFGTGAVKVTPAHDPNDYEAGKRNGLPQITVIGFDGNMTAAAGERYSGLDRYEARNLVAADLEELGLLEKVEDHPHRVPTCERCHTTIEPLLSDQWFMTMQGTPVIENAVKVVEEDQITFQPARYKRIYLDWMAGLRDWPLSRQLWWGHRIPVYYKPDGTYVAARNWDEAVQKAGTDELTQDEDVLDTWFSSALWPFATLGWPEKTADLDYFYPTDVLTTSREILYLWVARMIMTGVEFMGQKPFDEVYIFATVLDKKGRRMSKSLGNGIDPVEMIDKYGTDALRFSLLRLASKGQDIRFSEDRIPESRNFATKIWNAARFVLINLGEDFTPEPVDFKTLSMAERAILSNLQQTVSAVNSHFEEYDFDKACSEIYEFFWNKYCDGFIELCKPALHGDDTRLKRNAQITLFTVLETALRLLHPIMPFITEEIWRALPHTGESICLADYPEAISSLIDHKREAGFGLALRAYKAYQKVQEAHEYVPLKIAIHITPMVTAFFEEKTVADHTNVEITLVPQASAPFEVHRQVNEYPVVLIEKSQVKATIEELTRAEQDIELLLNSISAIRSLRADFTPGGSENETARAAILARRFTTIIVPHNNRAAATLREQLPSLISLARLGTVQFADASPTDASPTQKYVAFGVACVTFADVTFFIPATELLEGIDPAKESVRLAGEIAKLDKELASVQGRLNNPGFMQKAAPEAVEKARQDAADLAQRRAKLEARRGLLGM